MASCCYVAHWLLHGTSGWLVHGILLSHGILWLRGTSGWLVHGFLLLHGTTHLLLHSTSGQYVLLLHGTLAVTYLLLHSTLLHDTLAGTGHPAGSWL